MNKKIIKFFFILKGSNSELSDITLLKRSFNIVINLSWFNLIFPRWISTELIEISSSIISKLSFPFLFKLWLVLFWVRFLLGNLWLKLILLIFSIVSLFNMRGLTCGVDIIDVLWLKLFLILDKEFRDFDGDEVISLLLPFSSLIFFWLLSKYLEFVVWSSINVLFNIDLFKLLIGYNLLE